VVPDRDERMDSSSNGTGAGTRVSLGFSFRALKNSVDSTAVQPPGTKGLVVFGERNTAGLLSAEAGTGGALTPVLKCS